MNGAKVQLKRTGHCLIIYIYIVDRYNIRERNTSHEITTIIWNKKTYKSVGAFIFAMRAFIAWII